MKDAGYRVALEAYLAGPHDHPWVVLWPDGAFSAAPAGEPHAPCGGEQECDTILLELTIGALPRPRAELWRAALEVALADWG